MNDSHEQIRELLSAYVSGVADESEMRRVDEHVRACAACAKELDEYRQLELTMNAAFENVVPDGLSDRIISRISHEKFITPRTSLFALRAAAVAAVAAMLGVSGYFASGRIDSGTMPKLWGNPMVAVGMQAPLGTALPGDDTSSLKYAFQPGRVETAPAWRNKLRVETGQELGDAQIAGRRVLTTPAPQGVTAGVKLIEPKSASVAAGQEPAPAMNLERGSTGRGEGGGGGGGLWSDSKKQDEVAQDALRDNEKSLPQGDQADPRKASNDDPDSSGMPAQDKNKQSDTRQNAANAPARQPGQAQQDGHQVQQEAPVTQKIIRNGVLEFEVESFDNATTTVGKIVTEDGGYISTTNSERLANGRVRGTIIVRIAPEKLDTLVLKLRALGTLKSQNLAAQDITKQYTDLASMLRASRALEERLISIIKDGKGEVKDLLAAETELGKVRERIERVEGEIRYFNNLVSLSTLTINLTERDIAAAAVIVERQDLNMSLETDAVEAARGSAIQAVLDAKGRVVEATLQQLDRGRVVSNIVADVPADKTAETLEKLKVLGIVARLDVQRRTSGGENAPTGVSPRVEQRDSRFTISIQNLAAQQPRTVVTMQLAANDVEQIVKSISALVNKSGGRIIASNISRPSPDSVSGAINVEIPATASGELTALVQSEAVPMTSSSRENPDRQNFTASRMGFEFQITSFNQIPPRSSTQLSAEASGVENVLRLLNDVASRHGGRVTHSEIVQSTGGRTIASWSVELPSDKQNEVMTAIESQTKVTGRQQSTNADAPAGRASRSTIEITLQSPETLVAPGSGFWNTIVQGVKTSVAGLLWSLQLIVIGLFLVGPWVVIGWVGYRLLRKRRTSGATA